MTLKVENIEGWEGQQVVDSEGEKLGKLDEVLLDVNSGEPMFGSISSGLFGRKRHVVPLEGATVTRDAVRIAYGKDTIKDAPEAADDGEMTGAHEREALAHYGISRETDAADDDVRYESVARSAERSARAEELRSDADKLEDEAKREAEHKEVARKQAEESREASAAAGKQQEANLSDAEARRAEAERLEQQGG